MTDACCQTISINEQQLIYKLIFKNPSNHWKPTNLEFFVCKSSGRRPTFTSSQLLTDLRCFKAQGVFISSTQCTQPCTVVAWETGDCRHVARQMIDTRTVVTTQQVAAVTTNSAVVFIWINASSCLLRAILSVVRYTYTSVPHAQQSMLTTAYSQSQTLYKTLHFINKHSTAMMLLKVACNCYLIPFNTY